MIIESLAKFQKEISMCTPRELFNFIDFIHLLNKYLLSLTARQWGYRREQDCKLFAYRSCDLPGEDGFVPYKITNRG